MNWKRWIMVLVATLVSAGASAAAITPDEFFAWVEKEYAAVFQKVLAAGHVDYQGCIYDYRQYATDYYLGVCRSNQAIYYYTGGVLRDVNNLKLDDFKCQARPDLCGTAGFAGTVAFSKESDGVYAIFSPNYVGGKLTWLGADGNGFEIPLSDLDALCGRSLRLGNWGKKTGFGCAVPQSNGELRVRVPNNDCSRFVFWTKAGKELWLNLDDPKGWRVSGLNAKANAACGIEYGEGGFTSAKISAVQETDGTASLVWDFGSDFVNGFFGRDSQSIVIDHPAKLYGFVLNGSHAGKDYGHGWGLGEGRKTASGDPITPSIKMAWLENNNGKYFLKFRNLACTDKVNITVHSGSGLANNVVYTTGSDGFGLGWAGLPYQDNQSMWTAGSGAVFDRATGQVQYDIPFCKQ